MLLLQLEWNQVSSEVHLFIRTSRDFLNVSIDDTALSEEEVGKE